MDYKELGSEEITIFFINRLTKKLPHHTKTFIKYILNNITCPGR